ncbi:MAG: hypothetical protein K2N89_08630 [Lachnospiraceae bacterium]|nr:hypothetical protein [Lachnospiraceae bacterium]
MPGLVAALLHCVLNKKMNWKKILLIILSYAAFIDVLIFGALWMIGMRKFNLFEMSLRFKIKWLVLGLVLASVLVWSLNNIRRTDWSVRMCLNTIKRILPAGLFFVITYAILTPSSLFLQNINEFSFQYILIIPVILFVTVMIPVFLNLAALCITNEKTVTYYIAFLFGIALAIYIQGNFLNPAFPPLDGTEIDWSAYSFENVMSASVWFLCIFITFGLALRYKEKTEKIIKYIAFFLSAVQMISLVTLVMVNRLNDNANHGFSKEGEFTIGSEENIVVIILDTLQSSSLKEYLVSDAYAEGKLDDFTFFDNAVSGGAPTQLAMPLLITGVEYDPMQPIEEYKKEVWEEAVLFDDLHENGYDVRFYSTVGSFPGICDGIADNYEITNSVWIGDYFEFGRQLYKLVNFYVMPQFLKEQFWLTTDTMMDTIENTNTRYKIKDVQFYEDMQAAGELQVKYEKTFRLYHLNGVHKSYNLNENIETVEKDSVTEQQQLQGVMKIVYQYIEDMKKAGVYDASTIIIAGDHGRHENNNVEANPAVIIKRPYEQHGFEYNSAPIHFRNVLATMAENTGGGYLHYGPSVYDITDDSDVERLHTIDNGIRIRNYIDDEWDEDISCCRLFVSDRAEESDKCEVWDPYEINRINYKIGEAIDYNLSNDYAKQINYRLYKENGAATASNELSICFELTDYQKGDLDFHFTYSKVYNDEQNMRIYANGHKIATVTCTEADIHKENVVTIPKNRIENNKLIIRMVFPNAVTPNQIDRTNADRRVLSVAFDTMRLE